MRLMPFLSLLCLLSACCSVDETEEVITTTEAPLTKTVCDVTVDLNKDGCNDAVCKTLALEGTELGGEVLTEDLVIETRYFGTCDNPQELVLDPDCSIDPDVLEGDGCSTITCELPGGSATYFCE